MENGQKPVNQSGLKRIRDFTDLETWRFARQLRVDVYRICRRLPKEETLGLASQISLRIIRRLERYFPRFRKGAAPPSP